MKSAKNQVLLWVTCIMILGMVLGEMSLKDLETQDSDPRKYKYIKLKEHFPNKFKRISYK